MTSSPRPKDIADTITFSLGSRAGSASMRRTSTWLLLPVGASSGIWSALALS